jgi:RNA polymerase sigma-70 factor (ECF subfamily)
MPTTLTPEALLADRRWIEDLARRLVRDPNAADDVAQEAWRRALERPPADVTSPRGWLHSLVKSCAREMRRSETRRVAREHAASRPESTPGAAHLVARAEAQRIVLAEVLALDPASREVVLLRYFEDLEPWQIAKRLGEPQGTVRSRLHRALATLRGRLDDEHGGDRERWAVALCGPGWRSASPSAGATTLAKGVIVMTTQTKAVIAAAAVVAVLLFWWSADGAPPAPQPKAHAEEAIVPAPRAAPVRRTPAADETATTTESAPPAAPAPVAPVASGPKRLPVRLIELTPADPAAEAGGGADRRGGAIAGAGEAGGVMLGGGVAIEADGWTKWKPVPEKGTATLRGKVVDSTGAPLGGAEILRVDPAAGGADGDIRDYRHITPIGETAADGTFSLAAQPARAYRLVANWHHAMNRPAGLLLSGLVPVEPRENQTVAGIELRVPVDPRDFGAVTGRVVDDDGAPVATTIGVIRPYVGDAASGADGRFRLSPILAGETEIVVDDYDYRPIRRTVAVRAGAETDVELRLTQKLSGPHEIDGFLRDTDGRPVAGVPILCGGMQDLYRRRTTGADGSFRFRHLPSPPDGTSFYLSVFSDGIVLKTVNGIAAPTHGFVFEVERSVKLRLLIRDAATSAALPIFNVTISRAVEKDGATIMEPVVVTTRHEEDGIWTAEVPRGPLTLFVEAPEHRGFNGTVEVPREGADFEALIEMQR